MLLLNEEGENSHTNKGILSAPEAAWCATSIPPPSFFHIPPLFPLSPWIYYPLPLSVGLLSGPQLLNFMPRVNLVCLMVAAELQWRGLALFYLPLAPKAAGTEINLGEQRSVEVVSYEAEIPIGSTCTLKGAGATGSDLWTEKVYWRTGESCNMVDILLSDWNLNSLSN